MRKKLLLMLSLLMAGSVAYAQNWTQADSLRLDQLLKTDGEIKLNTRALEELRGKGFLGSQSAVSEKPWLEFDYTMPVLKLPKQAEVKMQIDMPFYAPPSNGVTFTGDLAYHLTKWFTRDYWDFRNKRNIKKTLEVLKNYDAMPSDSLQSKK
jgi:hypothetical protein